MFFFVLSFFWLSIDLSVDVVLVGVLRLLLILFLYAIVQYVSLIYLRFTVAATAICCVGEVMLDMCRQRVAITIAVDR